jgi:hypothetical protein
MKEKFYIGIMFIILSSTFVTLFSYTTSPIYSEWGDTPDSPIFQIIGKYWKEGWIPYKDLWDLKGPYIFFMDAIGYWLTGTRITISGMMDINKVKTTEVWVLYNNIIIIFA